MRYGSAARSWLAGLAALLLIGCATRPTTPSTRTWPQPCDDCVPGLRNFSKVNDGLWRAAQPDRNDADVFRKLERAGFSSPACGVRSPTRNARRYSCIARKARTARRMPSPRIASSSSDGTPTAPFRRCSISITTRCGSWTSNTSVSWRPVVTKSPRALQRHAERAALTVTRRFHAGRNDYDRAHAAGVPIVKNLGIVRGITVRSRSIVGNIVGGLQSLFGGNITVYTNLCEQAREETYKLMCEHADSHGANAIISMRYDATEVMAGLTEVLCYGTAVVAEPER